MTENRGQKHNYFSSTHTKNTPAKKKPHISLARPVPVHAGHGAARVTSPEIEETVRQTGCLAGLHRNSSIFRGSQCVVTAHQHMRQTPPLRSSLPKHHLQHSTNTHLINSRYLLLPTVRPIHHRHRPSHLYSAPQSAKQRNYHRDSLPSDAIVYSCARRNNLLRTQIVTLTHTHKHKPQLSGKEKERKKKGQRTRRRIDPQTTHLQLRCTDRDTARHAIMCFVHRCFFAACRAGLLQTEHMCIVHSVVCLYSLRITRMIFVPYVYFKLLYDSSIAVVRITVCNLFPSSDQRTYVILSIAHMSTHARDTLVVPCERTISDQYTSIFHVLHFAS